MKYCSIICFSILIFSSSGWAQKKATIDGLVGDWTGTSKCVSNDSNCHDEIVIYHVTKSKKDRSKANISADKIVNGKPDNMGEFDLKFDPEKMTLTADMAFPRSGGHGIWLFKIDGEKMDGTLTVFPGEVLFRRIHVERKKHDQQ